MASKNMDHIKLGKGKRVNNGYVQFPIFNDQDEKYFVRTMTMQKEYDFCKILKVERISEEETETRKEIYDLVKSTEFIWPNSKK